MMASAYRIEPVTGRAAGRQYTLLPYRLHRHRSDWVPPLRMDEHRTFSAANPATRYCRFARWLLRDERGSAVGRIAAIVNQRYNSLHNEFGGRFCELECPNDEAAAKLLLDTASDWLRAQGMTRVLGPMAFTDQDPEGFLVDGFDERTSIATYQNPPYIPVLLDALGWEKHVDYVVYRVPIPDELPRSYQVVQRRLQHGRFTLMEFRRRRELEPLVRPILQLMNDTFTEIEGYSPLDAVEMDDLARRYLPVLDPRFVKAARDDTGLAGFVIALPDLTAGLRRSGGRLLPFGWFHLLRAARRAQRLDLLLGGIRPDCRGKGVDVLMGSAMIASARTAGYHYMDSHHELEHNMGVRREMEAMGGVVYKRFRIYRREL